MAVVRYLVVDVDAAVAFYTGVLGFELVEQWGPPFAMVRRDDLTLWLSGPGSSAARPLADDSRPAPGGWNRLSCTFTISAFLRRQIEQSHIVSSGKSVSTSNVTAPQWQLPR